MLQFPNRTLLMRATQYDVEIISNVLMRGYMNKKTVGVDDPRNTDLVGKVYRSAIEMRKR